MIRTVLMVAVLAGGVAFGVVLAAGPDAEEISLPAPTGLDMSLGDALRQRRSVRSFDVTRRPSQAQLGALLWAAAGVNRPDPDHPQGGKRTAPSAFGAGAVDVVIASKDGLFRYRPARHALVRLDRADHRKALTGATWAREAPLLMLLVADLGRYPERVSAQQRQQYARADAAVIGQNLYLATAALGLGTVLTAGVDPRARDVLDLRSEQNVIFVLPVGYPRG